MFYIVKPGTAAVNITNKLVLLCCLTMKNQIE